MKRIGQNLPRIAGRALALCLALLACVFFHASTVRAQVSAGGTPLSFGGSIAGVPQTITMPAVDVATLRAEDEQLPKEERNRFAAPIEVLYSLSNSGTWTSLPNGDRIWRLRISSHGATSLGLVYNQWFIPKGGLLWLYNDDHSMVIGAFTSFNNWTGGTNITQPLSGDAVTLEYLEPAAAHGQSQLSISRVCHGYRDLFPPQNAAENFGNSGSCNVNINCPAGAPLLNYKHGVAMIISGGVRWCTGSLINDVPADGTPYFLTANHCLDGNESSWVFVFNYESAACSPNTDGPTTQTVANATLLANNSASDFALLRLSSVAPTIYAPFYNGWDRRDATWIHSYNISHPSGDVKKLAIDNDAVTSDTWSGTPTNSHWRIGAYDVGMTEGGSSGSPLFDVNYRISGQLHGGPALCSNPGGSDYYGKLSLSWNNGTTAPTRLRDWLDPANSGLNFIDGMFIYPPNNDICAGAYPITSLPYSNSGNTNFANNDYPHVIFGNSPDVVYSLMLPCSTVVTASLCGSGFDTGIEVRTGGSCPGSTLVTYDDDFCAGFGPSQTTFTARAGQQYWILVYGYGQGSGPFTLNVSSAATYAPSNDVCPGTLISSLPYSDVGGTACAAANYTNCVTTSSPEVMYTLNVPSCQTVTVSLCGSSFDTQLSVRGGGVCPGDYPVACDDDYCGSFGPSQVTFVAQANVDYFLLVSGWSGGVGSYVLNVTGAPFTPPNDVCPGTTIASLPYNTSGNTGCSGYEGYPHCGGSGASDVVYNYTPTTCQTIFASLCGSGYDTRIDVRAGGDCPGGMLVTCNDDTAFCAQATNSAVSFNAYAGVTYYILVSGYGMNAGPFVLNMYQTGTFTPANDVCPGTTIASLPFTDVASTTCDVHNYTNGLGNSSPDAVYAFTSGTCQNVSVSLCGSGFDTGLSVYRNGACPGTTLVATNDDNLCGGSSTLQSTLGFQASAGVAYYILVHGYSSYSGPYVLNVTGQPCNSLATIDSLIIQPFDPDILLEWKFQGPAYKYYIYRSTSPTGLVSPANRIDSTTSWAYWDFGAVNASARYFYAVTAATLPTLMDGLADGNDVRIDKATASPTSEPFFADAPAPVTSAEEAPKPGAQAITPVYVPAYDDLNTHYTPNPAKGGQTPAK